MLNIESKLKNFIQTEKAKATSENRPPVNHEKETDRLFLEYMKDYANKKQNKDPSLKNIPRFFNKNMLEKEEFSIQNLIKKQARSRFLHHKTCETLGKDDLEALWEEVKKHYSPPLDQTERINYDSFLRIAKSLPDKCRHFFSASSFLKFDRDEYGRIDALSFFHSIVRKVSLYQTRIQLSLFDSYGNGYLTESDLENFIQEQIIPSTANLSSVSGSDFMPYYLLIATRKFFFFLDPKKLGKIFIKDILTSPILSDLYDLRIQTSEAEFLNNWFSVENAQKIYKSFTQLDEDKNNLLSVEELTKMNIGYTDLFLKRVMEVLSSQKLNFQLDFRRFIDFMLITQNRKTIQSMTFVFKCLDIFNQGKLDSLTINMFFKEIRAKLMEIDSSSESDIRVEDVKDEIFDMSRPLDAGFITFQDLLNTGQGDVIMSLLVDFRAFFNYDQREYANQFNGNDDDTVFSPEFPEGQYDNLMEELDHPMAPGVSPENEVKTVPRTFINMKGEMPQEGDKTVDKPRLNMKPDLNPKPNITN